MQNFIKTQEIVKEMNRKVLGGAKIPHSCSMPVFREVDGEYKICIFVQPTNIGWLRQGMMERPSRWCSADIPDGGNFREYHCENHEFCPAPYGWPYDKGTTKRGGTWKDRLALYSRLDKIRMAYTESGRIDMAAYGEYLSEVFQIVPSGQIRFYKALSM